MISFSIVINTLNRAMLLERTLDSLRWLRYEGDFEVIVVNGPSTDTSDAVIAAWSPRIRAGSCDVANLSISRNIGICMARGDVVAFIDDDAIPEPEWLTQLAKAYDSPEVGGAGGLVFDQTGYALQYAYSTADRLGNANWAAGGSAENLCFPGSFQFPYLQGTNASFRRSALMEVGGFDEEIEYYLDETELCCRLVDSGYLIRQLPNAYVHHKFAPSNIRDQQRITRYRYPVIKNKIYFSLKHGRDYFSIPAILDDARRFSDFHRSDVEFHISGGRLEESELGRFSEESERAWERGVTRGLSGNFPLISLDTISRCGGAFLPFQPIINERRRHIVLVCRDFPPNHSGGIATFNECLAQALATQGHVVHVITESPDINRVDLESGVWLHRIAVRDIAQPKVALALAVPQHIWNWSATAFEEALRIATHRRIDIVEAPIWDCEGVAFLLDRRWPLVTSLQTTLHFWLDTHPEQRADSAWMDNFGNPMLALERHLMSGANAVRAISRSIAEEIERAYDFRFPPAILKILPLGIELRDVAVNERLPERSLQVLFVGRLEPRKGIDVLLASIPAVLQHFPEIKFEIIGDDKLVGTDGIPFKDAFLSKHAGEAWLTNVTFSGRVNQEELLGAYANCDIFVAPSRFESFGLVFLEAMRESKPVIGCDAGGMPEVVEHGKTGLLVEPGNVAALIDAIQRLAADPSLRARLGEAGRKSFEKKFSSGRMAEDSRELYELAEINYHGHVP